MSRRSADFDLLVPDEESPDGPLRRRLGRYELCFELASGGMATVYLARMTSAADAASLERLVALKLIHRHLAHNSDFVEMFLDEARIAARINHPNVCTVYDFGEERGVYYIAMELLEGESLHQVMRRASQGGDPEMQRMWPAFAARIVADAAEGLHAAHELMGPRGEPLQVVHRDVSLQNLFVCYDGSVRVVDFGIARASDRVHQTVTGTLKGKYAYMAPEQLLMSGVDRRADIWSLGVVLWEMLARKRLFKRATEPQTIQALQQMEVPGPSTVTAGVPSALDPIVLRALSRDPARRHATARELGRDLSRFILSFGEPAGVAELADWMRSTFAEQFARRRTLAELARETATDVPRVSHALTDEPSNTSTAVTAVTTKARTLLDELASSEHETRELRPFDPEERTRPTLDAAAGTEIDERPPRARVIVTRRGMARTGAGAVGALLLIGLGVLLGGIGDDDRPEPTTVATEPGSRDEPPSPRPIPTTGGGDEQALQDPGAESSREVEATPEPVVDVVDREPEKRTAPNREPAARRPVARRGSRTAAPPPPRGSGTVLYGAVGGWATVRAEGHGVLGRTPGRAELPTGPHTLEFTPPGTGPPIRQRVVVRRNGTHRVSVDLTDRAPR